MVPAPSRTAEALVGFFVPPACREEVLGDLYERYRSPQQYVFEALRTVPMVVLSRMVRTTDRRVFLIQACALYSSFVGAAALQNPELLQTAWPFVRLAVPCAIALLVFAMEDAYKPEGPRSLRGTVLGTAAGIGLAVLANLPYRTFLWGAAVSLVLSSAIRSWFPPPTDRLQAIQAPAGWLPESDDTAAKRFLMVVMFLIIVWQLWKKGWI